ncbi:hypothetical protein [Weissella confusa]|uniref:hypothetical protein n=1 Tax=Weissella confusa TaxID=1583 RepID=UPI00223B9B07|nr:hypothetical protein [Weissella confusa]
MSDLDNSSKQLETGFLAGIKVASQTVSHSELSKQAKLYVLRLMLDVLKEMY